MAPLCPCGAPKTAARQCKLGHLCPKHVLGFTSWQALRRACSTDPQLRDRLLSQGVDLARRTTTRKGAIPTTKRLRRGAIPHKDVPCPVQDPLRPHLAGPADGIGTCSEEGSSLPTQKQDIDRSGPSSLMTLERWYAQSGMTRQDLPFAYLSHEEALVEAGPTVAAAWSVFRQIDMSNLAGASASLSQNEIQRLQDHRVANSPNRWKN